MTLKDKPFIFRDTQVKAYVYGDTIEMTTSHGKHSNPIRKLNSDEFLDLRTGEIRLYDKRAVNRSDNLKAVKRTFVKLRRLVGNNFFGGSTELWVTLTYRENMTNPETAYEDFRAFMKTLRRKYPNILYISVIEPQARGSWHYHVLLKNDAPIFIENEYIAKIWKKGFTRTKRIKSSDKLGNYLTAYLTNLDLNEIDFDSDETNKSIVKGARLHLYPKGIRIYRKSRKIKHPETITAKKDIILKRYQIENKEADFSTKSTHKMPIGNITYITEFYDNISDFGQKKDANEPASFDIIS